MLIVALKESSSEIVFAFMKEVHCTLNITSNHLASYPQGCDVFFS